MAWVRVALDQQVEATEALRRIARLRTGLWQRGFRVDPEMGAHRSEDGQLYFELEAVDHDGLTRAAQDVDPAALVTVLNEQLDSEECLNCGNLPGGLQPAVCPNCNFREISACPHCRAETPRGAYNRHAGDLFRCPACGGFVRLEFVDPLWEDDGHYRQPVVVVVAAEGEA